MTLSPIVSAQWLAENLAQCKVLDISHSLMDADFGLRSYQTGHIPGAHFVSLDHGLSDLSQKHLLGRHPLPTAEHFANVLASCGITRSDAVVVYDQDTGAFAARAWWMLRAVGFDRCALLDGGMAAWRAAALPISTQAEALVGAQAEELSYEQMPQIDSKTLQQKLSEASIRLLDARPAPRFEGREEPIDPVAGHVPGALNRPVAQNLRADGRFKSPEELRAEFLAVLGNYSPEQTVAMCGSGVTACHNLLAMEVAGLPGAALYAPSWSGWIIDRERPIALSLEI